jgi:diguanylate cyclase (GGDEF)-like protein
MHAQGAVPSSAVSWRLLGLLFVASGALGLAMLPLEQNHPYARWPIVIVALVALVFGLLTVAIAARIPEKLLIVGIINCCLLVSTAVVLSGGPDSPFLLLYAWTGVEAWYFLSRRLATWFTVAAAVIIGVTLMVLPHGTDGGPSAWLIVVGTMIALGLVTDTLRARADRLIEALADQATRDSLTGLTNRRGYHERIEQELARAERNGTAVSIVLADLDSFKALNDAFGHRYGDQALCEFSELCQDELRTADLISRVGGEEFAIVLPEVDRHEALGTAERLRRAVRQHLSAPDGRALSASFGIASFPEHGRDPEVLLDNADQAMYAAKHLGRDRTVVFSEGLLDALRGGGSAEPSRTA